MAAFRLSIRAPSAAAQRFLRVRSRHRLLRRCVEPGNGIVQLLRGGALIVLEHAAVKGCQPRAAIGVLRKAQELRALRTSEPGHQIGQDVPPLPGEILGFRRPFPKGPIPAIPDIGILPGREDACDFPALVIQKGQGLAGILGAAQLGLQLRAAGIQGQSPHVLQKLRQGAGLGGIVTAQMAVVGSAQRGELLYRVLFLLGEGVSCNQLLRLPAQGFVQLKELIPFGGAQKGNTPVAVPPVELRHGVLRRLYSLKKGLEDRQKLVLLHLLVELLVSSQKFTFLWHDAFISNS